jgi:hypothetical protein
MHLDSNNIEKYLETLDKNSSPKWGAYEFLVKCYFTVIPLLKFLWEEKK